MYSDSAGFFPGAHRKITEFKAITPGRVLRSNERAVFLKPETLSLGEFFSLHRRKLHIGMCVAVWDF
jgi:hypothetical protein